MHRAALRAILAVGALVLGTMAVPAVAAPLLSVDGSGPSFADFTVTTPTTFDYGNAVVRGDGRYAGFALWNAARTKSYGGVVVMADLAQPARPMPVAVTDKHAQLRSDVLGVPVITLPVGRYRVYLLADGHADIRIPLSSGNGIDVTTTAASAQAVTTTTVAIAATNTSAALRAPVTFQPSTMSYVIARLWTTLGTEMTLTSCVTRRGAACSRGQYVQVVHPPDSLVALGYDQSGIGVRGAHVQRVMGDVRAEATFSSVRSGTLALGILTYDLA